MDMPRKSRVWFVVMIAALAVVGPSDATVMIAMDFDRMAAEADGVVLGDVASVTARWSADGSIIETVVEIAVDEDLSGTSAPGTVRIVQPGGWIGETGYVLVGTPIFHEGERVLVFLQAQGPDVDGTPFQRVVGMAQGKFNVLPRLDGGWDAVQHLPSGLALAAPDPDGTIRIDATRERLVLDLTDAVARIREIRGLVTP